MDLRQLEYFLTVAKTQGFSNAASALGLTQPALSRQVARLEEELGVRLLVRNGRGVEVTEAGQSLAEHAQIILDQVEQVRADMSQRQQSPRGKITVGLPPRVALTITTELVMSFRERFPDAAISIAEALSIPLREWLISGRVDIAVLFDPPPSPALNFETLAQEPLVMVSQQALPDPIRFSEAVEHSLVMPSGPHALRQIVEMAARPRKLNLRVVAEVDSVQAVLPLVKRGLASTLVPISAVRNWTDRGQTSVSRVIAPSIRNRLVLAQAKARPDTTVSRATKEFLRDLVKAHYSHDCL